MRSASRRPETARAPHHLRTEHLESPLGLDTRAPRFSWRLPAGAEAQLAYRHVRALAFDLVPAQLRPVVAGRLVELVRAAGTHVGTGFLATCDFCRSSPSAATWTSPMSSCSPTPRRRG